MNPIIYDTSSVFLVVTGAAHEAHVAAAANGMSAITFRQQSPHGAIDLAIAAPADLAAYADLAAAAILKPVCLPIALTHVRHGIVHAQLSDQSSAHKLAQRFLAVMAATNHPVPPRRCLHDRTASRPHTGTKEK